MLYNIAAGQDRIAYNDAKLLTRLYQSVQMQNKKIPTTNDQVKEILRYYFGAGDLSVIVAQNAFLKPYFSGGGSASLNGTEKDLLSGAVSGMSKGMGGLDITSLADGLAKFLVKRTKQELFVAFFERFPAFKKKYPEFPKLFPATTALMDHFDAWEYSNILSTLKEALEKDLKKIPSGFNAVLTINTETTANCGCDSLAMLRIQKFKSFFYGAPGILINCALQITDAINTGQELPDIIAGDAYERIITNMNLNNDAKEKNIRTALRFIRIISNSIRSTDLSSAYVSPDSIKAMLADEVAGNLYAGLISQRMNREQISINGQAVSSFLSPANIELIKNYISNVSTVTTELAGAMQRFRYTKMIAVSATPPAEWENILSSVEHWTRVITDVTVIHPAFVLPTGYMQLIEKIKQTIPLEQALSVKNYHAAVIELLQLVNSETAGKPDEAISKFLVKYGSFAANVVDAKNSDDIVKAIETLVLPVGSAAIKKHSVSNIALQAYTGLYIGQQRQATDKKFTGVAGVYAPVGVAFSWGTERNRIDKKDRPGSVSLFVSAIDIGPLVAFRFSNYNDTLANDIHIRIGQIVSPGLHLAYGIPRCPLSIGFGANWSPLLTDVEKNVIKLQPDNKNAFRFQAFLAVDIPLLNFHNRSRQ
jgi:hypothetical protein